MNRSLEKLRNLLGPEVELYLVKRELSQDEVCPALTEDIARIIDSCSTSFQEVERHVIS